MSTANDETLLGDEDGEDEYDLGNEEEEALLAEDCDEEQELHHGSLSYLKKSAVRKGSYGGDQKMFRDSEEPLEEDVLDLDDFESDILENTEYAEDVDFNDSQLQDELEAEEQREDEMSYHSGGLQKSLMESEVDEGHSSAAGLRNQEGASRLKGGEPIQMPRLEEEQGVRQKESEDDEEEEEKDEDSEGRGRFKSERTTVISLKGSKSYGNIPDTLDGVITGDDKLEGLGRWKRSGGRGGAAFQRGGFRGNQRGFGPSFAARRKQIGANRPGGVHQGMEFIHGRGEGLPDSMRDVIGPSPSPFMLSQNIHFNPHFKGNILHQPEGPPWNDSSLGNSPSSNSGGLPSHGAFHDLPPRFPPPSIGPYGGGSGVDHSEMLPGLMDHHRQQRQRSPPPHPPPYHTAPGTRSGGYDSPPSHADYHRDEPYNNRRPPHPESWISPNQRMQESPMGPPGGHHHQFGGGGGGNGHQHFAPGIHNERGGGGGDMMQHFRPTMQPGPLFSHVTTAAAPQGIPPQQNMVMQQQQHQHLQNLMRSAPPMHNAGMGPMLQLPPQEPHTRIPPPGFSPNEGRSIPPVHHGMQSAWHDAPIHRSPMGGGQHIPMQQQHHSGYHHGGAPRPYLNERNIGSSGGGNGSPLVPQGAPQHHVPVASMSAPPPLPFHPSGGIPQGGPPPPHPLHQQHQHQEGPMRQNSLNQSSAGSGGHTGGHNNGRFPRQQGGGSFRPQGFNCTPPHQGVRPNQGMGHMAQGHGGLAARRGMGTPNTRPMPTSKSVNEEAFPPKRPSVDATVPAMKPSPLKKRKVQRKIVKNNLLEVETVDTLPDTTTTGDKEATAKESSSGSSANKPEPEDAELLEYQKRIEQQKRLREKILQQKEQRRKLMALQKQKELQEKAAAVSGEAADVPKGNAIATIVNRNPVEPSPSTLNIPVKKEMVLNQSFVPPINRGQPVTDHQKNHAQLMAARKKALNALRGQRSQNIGHTMGRGIPMRSMTPRGGMAHQPLRPHNLVTVGVGSPGGNVVQQATHRSKVIQMKSEQGQLVGTKVPIHTAVAGRGSAVGRGQALEESSQPVRPMGQGRGQLILNKQVQQVQAPGGLHRLVQMLPPQQGHPQNQEPKVQPNKILQRVVKVNMPGPNQQQQQGRKVMVQNIGGGGDCISTEGGLSSGSVVVENLALTTTDADLRDLCQTIGRVKSIKMVAGMRSALVEFAHPSSAVAFFQRCQRKMVNLSMITVRLANS